MTQPSCALLAPDPSAKCALWARECLARSGDWQLKTPADVSELAADGDDLIVIPLDCCALDAGTRLIAALREHRPNAPLLIVGSGFSHAQISHVLAEGAYDYVSSGVSEAELIARIKRGLRFLARPEVSKTGSHSYGLIGTSPSFVKVLSRLPLLGRCNANVLIQGETGTGKELVAQAIHYLSGRDGHPWVPVNCGAIPHDLIEAELFGHTRGAYTSAHFAREGLIAAAESGTLFLDEIDSLALPLQSKLLRFLQEKEYRPVGSTAVRRANVRVVAASNTDLARNVFEGRFRQDLYYRLNVLNLKLPPLRDRRVDIAPLARHFLAHFAREFGRNLADLSPAALDWLCRQDWPGNVRELAHTVERAVLLAQGRRIEISDLSDLDETPCSEESFQDAKARVVEQFERSYLARVLAENNGNISHAASAAKKNRRALFELIRKHGIETRQFRL